LNGFVSGATGFIGGAIARVLAANGMAVFGGARRDVALAPGITPFITGDLSTFDKTLPPVEVVVHAAGLGHRRGVASDIWRRANVDAAVRLAEAARAAGAQKFILISTAHVYGRVAAGVVTDDTAANPMDDYAASKLEAERKVAQAFGAGLTILRPVAVTGPGCPGNLQLLMKLLKRGTPLPFGAIKNRRSFIDAEELGRLALAVIQAEVPPNMVLAAHADAVSTPDLIRALALGMGVRASLIPLPPAMLGVAARCVGRGAMWQSLAGSFVADPRAALGLGWTPRQSLVASIVQTARYNHTTRLRP
jgi:UDP-glucose 4-epimerase